MTRRTWICATCRIEHTCTLSLVVLSDHSSHHMAQAARTCLFTFIPSMHMCGCPWVFLSFAFYFLLFLFLFPFLMTDGDSMTINNLRDSANGTFVTLDDYLSLTGYEPNAMEFTNATELNDAVSSDFIDFQDSLVHIAPSSDHYMDDDTLGKLLAEVHRYYVDYRRPEGVSVSPSSMSVMVDRTGRLVERSDSDHFGFSVRNVKSARNQFPVIAQAERMVDRTGNLWKKWLLRSVKALVRRLGLCLMHRKTIIAGCCEKVSHHELLAAQAEHERRMLQEELLRQQQDFREVQQQNLIKLKELQKFQSSTFDTLASLSGCPDRPETWETLPKTETIRSHNSKAGKPSNLSPVSKEIISDSVELCETAICFLHIQLIGTECMTTENTWCSTWSGFRIFKISCEIEVLKQSQSAFCLAVFLT